ncbi:CxxxxCH/CxxCH domain-containing protein [Geobacter pelophilus]|uniref:CxxxxCH/CxxCH domain-containing protein n=1 Tax=Geoanaerobacter pelophilus TaxID=60036 RepID=A0AAW4L1Z3_9BACT|nr:CxxxxCH/CxxCH domain-containing protein [Geoanaerobacter pelophilus]MBT0664888.1 CxxxxCH/CxxCH domain-containing protein [Geoanaerobacter pelophilus]
MGRMIAKSLSGMNIWAKAGLVLGFTLLVTLMLKPLITDSATNTYYFTLDGTGQNLGADGTTNSSATLGGKISMATGTYNTSRNVTAASNTNWQVMLNVYGPVYAAAQTLTTPAITIGTRDYNGTSNPIYWKADVYDYDPAGTAGNGTLLWSTSGSDESHPNTPSAKTLTFSAPAAKNISQNHRLKVVVSSRMTSTNSSARLYWGSSTNYSFFTVTEAATAANTVSVTNLADYNRGALASVLLGEQNIAMLKFDLYANAATNWTGGKLDKIGSNTNLGNATFSVYKDANGNGAFDAGIDTLIGGPYSFSQATGSGYTLGTPQTLTANPQKYFITYSIAANATTATTIGARIVDNTYFTVTNGLAVAGVTSTSSSIPTINGAGAPVNKTYAADWDSGTTLLMPENGGPSATNSVCVTSTVTDPAGTNNVGLLNFPAHTCTSVSGRYHTSSEANAKFVTLYFNGPSGYSSVMSQVKGISIRFRARSTGSSATFTSTLFYVRPDGVRVNSPVSSTYSTSTARNATISLAGQTFANVPAGSRIGIQIGVSKANASIGLGSSVTSQLILEETAAAGTGVNIGDGTTVSNSNVLAASTGNVVNSFTLSSPTGNQTVTSLTVTGNAATTSANVSLVRLYSDNGVLGVLDPADIELGTGSFSGNSAVITGLAEGVGSTLKSYLVVYDISSNPATGAQVSGLVSAAGGVTVDGNADLNSATLTILPTTTITNGTAEPPNTVIPSGGSATNLNAFGLSVNGGANDLVNTVTVSMQPAGISAKVAMLEIVDRNTGALYGNLTAPTSGDDWRVSTSGLFATSGTTQCYVRITPKNYVTSTYSVTGVVTAITHVQGGNGVTNNDSSSATVVIDGQAPSNPVLTAATATNSGEIQLNWTPASDLSGLHATNAYKVVRGVANAPAPVDCSSGTVVYQGQLLSKVDTGLSMGQKYAYRVCAADVVNNVSSGTTAAATAQVPTVCTNAPSVAVNPVSGAVKTGKQVTYSVAVTNNDTGACGNTSFNLALVGAENSTDFVTPSTLSPTVLTLGPNGAGSTTTLTVTAKATAPQGATNSFNIRVTATGHPTVDTANSVHTVVNNYGELLHSSLTLGTSKFGEWGTTHTCNTCHTKSATTNIKKISETVATPTGNKSVVFNRLSTSPGITTGVLGNDRRSGTTSSNICEVCHHKTRFHQNSTSKVAWLDHNNSSDCVKCHSHSKGFKYIGGANCDDCHGTPPTTLAQMSYPATNALGLLAPNAGAHATHKPITSCYACHNNYQEVVMGNNRLEMGFKINNANFPGFNGTVNGGTFTGTNALNAFYRWTTSAGTVLQTAPNTTSCNVYCHGWSGGGGSNTNPSWVGTSQATCGTCHNATGANPPTSGSHVKHSGTMPGSNRIACSRCHATYANYTTTAHINGKVEWNMSPISASAAYNGINSGSTGAVAPTNPSNYGTCSNLYCHSNVQGATSMTLGTGGPTFYATPKWGDLVTCGSCHRNMYIDPAATGGHVQHAQNPETSFDCRICHSTGGTTNPENHASGNIDLSFSGVAVNTVYSEGAINAPGSGYGNCSNSDCHGRHTVTWGPPTALPLCDKCHGSATTAAFYGTAGPGSTTAKTDPYVGAHDQHLKSAPYSYSTGTDCEGCHFQPAGPYSPGHLDTALPAEITFGHIAGMGGFYGYTATPAYSYGSRQCGNFWCHGSGMDSNTGKGAYASVVADGGALTTPFKPTWNVPFLTGSAANDCTRCHGYPPPAPNVGYTHYGKGPSSCNGCHNNVNTAGTGFINPSIHVNGIVDGGCISCHGNPPIDTASLVKPAMNSMAPGSAGAHNAHLLNPMIGNDCYVCHNNYTSQMPSNTMEIGFKAYSGKVSSGVFYGYSTLTGNVYVSSSPGTTVRRTNDMSKQNTCANVYCHGGGTTTKAALGGGTVAAPNWEMGYAEVACGSCHGVSTTAAPTAGSHPKHALETGGGLGLVCYTCHGAEVNNYHVNGNTQWHLNSTDARVGTLARYRNLTSGGTGNLAPSATFGTCANFYCHSNVQGTGGTGQPSGYTPQTWGATGPLSCSACHKDMATDATGTGSHKLHAGTAGNARYSCSVCHYGAGSGTLLHADHIIQLSFDPAAKGAGTVYTAGSHQAGSGPYSTCSASKCHGRGTPTWGSDTATLSCDKCHGYATTNPFKDTAGSSVSAQSGAHAAHLNALTGYSNPVACSECHTVPALNDAVHMNGTTEVPMNGTLARAKSVLTTYSSATRSCGTTYCHGATEIGANGQHPRWSNTSYLTGTPSNTGDCDRCHGCPPNTNGHASLAKPAVLNSCNGCHTHVNTDGTFTAGTNRTKHINGSLEVNGSGACNGCHGANNNGLLSVNVSKGHAVHYNRTSVFRHYTGSNRTLASAYAFACKNCHGKTETNHMNSGNLADIAISGGTYTFGTYSARDGRGYKYKAGTCSQNSCHWSGNSASQSPVQAMVNWSSAMTSNCGKCHNKAGDSASVKWTAAHTKHVTTYNGNPALTCNACHSTTASNNTTVSNYLNHLNGTKTVAIAGGGSYTQSSYVCANVYCHSSGQASPNYVFISWTTSSSRVTCTTCHGGAGGNNKNGVALTTPHAKHLASGTYNYRCSVCHYRTTDLANNTVLKNFTGVLQHANGTRTVAILKTYSGSWSGTNCATTYCHSNGATGAGRSYTTQAWSGTSGCTFCHGGPTTLTTNRHASHLNNTNLTAQYTCNVCHVLTASNNTTIAAGGYAYHLNKKRDINFDGYSGSWSGTTCNNTRCHANRNPAWTAAATTVDKCTKCHGTPTIGTATEAQEAPGNAANGVNGYDLDGHTANGPTKDPQIGAHQQHLGGYGSTNIANVRCLECHAVPANATASGHLNGRRPGEITFANATAARKNGATPTSVFGVPFGVNATTCSNVYCHGSNMPKGDTSGTKRSTIFWNQTSLLARNATPTNADCGVCHGNPPTTGTTAGTHSSYVSQPTTSCSGCHTHFNANGTLNAGANRALHINGRVDAAVGGCNGCHGGNNSGLLSVNASIGHAIHYNRTSVFRHYTGSNRTLTTAYAFACKNCHGKTESNHQNGGNRADISVAGGTYIFGTLSARDGRSYKYTTGGTCSQNSCHWSGNSLNQAPVTATVTWTTGKTSNCSTCHNKAGDGSPKWSAAHTKHVNTYLGNTTLTCNACHSTTAGNNTTISNYINHLNGTKTVAIAGGGTYTAASFTCANVYCHSSGQASPNYVFVSWTTSSSRITCTTCHGGAGVNNRNGVALTAPHVTHLTGNYSFRCSACHYRTADLTNNAILKQYTGVLQHVNGTRTVTFPSAYGGSWNGANCSTTYCHSNGKGSYGAANSWTPGALNCTSSCHSLAAKPHASHLSGTYAFTCDKCHANTAAAGSSTALKAGTTSHVNGTYNVNGTDVKFASFSSSWRGSFSGNSCNNVYCHSNGKGSYRTQAWTAGTLNCASCHPTLGGAHNRHTGGRVLSAIPFYNCTSNASAGSDPLSGTAWANYGFGCASCHPYNTSSHLNGTIDVILTSDVAAGTMRFKNPTAGFTPGLVGSVGSNTVQCANIYCHSDGSTGYTTTAAWNTTYGADRCGNCHGNAPATGAHTKHAIGIHANNIFAGRADKLGNYSSPTISSAHGDDGQSTPISCNICHYATTEFARNKYDARCSACHTGDSRDAGRIYATSTATRGLKMHVNGSLDIALAPVQVKSKAQIRPASFVDYTAAGGYWNRNAGNYKNGPAAYDTAKTALSTGTMWNGTTKTCSNIACHMAKPVTWNAGRLGCNACHSKL